MLDTYRQKGPHPLRGGALIRERVHYLRKAVEISAVRACERESARNVGKQAPQLRLAVQH